MSYAMRSSRPAIEKGLLVRAVPEVLQSKLYTGRGLPRWAHGRPAPLVGSAPACDGAASEIHMRQKATSQAGLD